MEDFMLIGSWYWRT